MNILAINTSEKSLSLAICQGDQLLYEVLTHTRLTHGERLMPHIAQAFEECPFNVKDLDRIVVAQGPGSYTALRIAVTTAKTLAWTLDIDLVGVSSLAVLADTIHQKGAILLPLMDARRGNIYTGLYQRQDAALLNLQADRQVNAEEWIQQLKNSLPAQADLYVIGQDLPVFIDLFEKEWDKGALTAITGYDSYPSAYRLAQLGRQMDPTPPHQLVPAYLKLTEAEENWLKDHPQEGDCHV